MSTAYAPSLSADGRTVAFVEVAANPMSASTRWASRVVVASAEPRAGAGARRAITAGDSYEPTLSTDGTRVAFSRLSNGRSQVFVGDLRNGYTLLASRLPAGAVAGVEAWAPSLSADGRRVAFAARDRPAGGASVYVRDLDAGITERAGAGDEPSLSADGRTVAYSVPSRAGMSASGRPRQQIRVAMLDAGRARIVSVDGADVPADGWSGQPALSGDATKLAFTTDAVSLGAGGRGPGNLHVVVRDLFAGTTTTANPPAPVQRCRRPEPQRAPVVLAGPAVVVSVVAPRLRHGCVRRPT